MIKFSLKIRRFRKVSDAGIVGGWLLDRDLPEALKFDLPKIGWLVTDLDSHPIAAGFIRKMENCRIGLVDSYITNPRIAPSMRNDALNYLTMTILAKAPYLGFTKLQTNTTERHIIERAGKHGFEILPHIMMQKTLEERE